MNFLNNFMPNTIKLNFLKSWSLVVKTLVCFHKVWVYSLMDACINISCTNVVYKHVYIMENGVKNFFTCNFVTTCHDKKYNMWLHDPKKKHTKQNEINCVMTWRVIPHHINLGLHICMSCFRNKKLSSATCDYVEND